MLPEEATAMIAAAFTGNHPPQTWADLGCGSGVFTRALASLLPTGSTVYAVDKINTLSQNISSPQVSIIFRQQDFEQTPLELPLLDGILMANALHYVHDKTGFLQKIQPLCHSNTALLLVEYDTDIPVARWVPYPLSFHSCKQLFGAAGFQKIDKLNERPSVYGRANMYSALIQHIS